jgi:hydroxyacylglutathione hydrolase
MKLWKTERKNEIFQVLSGRNNCFLIPSEKGNMLIDTGLEFAYSSLRKDIEHLHLATGKIDYLILTHTHFDHCRNARAIQAEYGSQIVVGEKEADFVEEGYTPIPKGTFTFTKFLVHIGNKLGSGWFSYEPFSADIRVEDHFNLMDGDLKIDLISTPGHSTGSISIIVDDEIALVGDVMLNMFGDAIFPPFADDIPEMICSWEKLLNTSCRLFLPGHRKEISRELLEQEFQKYARKYHLFEK